MYIRKITKGYIDVPNGTIDITDPCYDSGTWCRLTVDVKPTEYRCNYYVGSKLDDDEITEYTEEYNTAESDSYIKTTYASLDEYLKSRLEDIKHRCFEIEIQEKGRAFKRDSKQWKNIGSIGVDAGMAGFFMNKPDFNDDEWSKFCDYVFKAHGPAYLKKTLGFWSDSGYGDGGYDVFAIKEKGQIIALRIQF